MTPVYRSLLRGLLILVASVFLAGCSLAKHMIDHAPYTVLDSEGPFELRHYNELLLVSAPMQAQATSKARSESAFRMLFAYISGANSETLDISMTAPVFMDADRSQKMSFVLPAEFTMKNTPQPANPEVMVERISDYTVASIRFNGRLQPDNINEHTQKLTQWMQARGYQSVGPAVIAGYDPPSALPLLRRNEVLIPIQQPEIVSSTQRL